MSYGGIFVLDSIEDDKAFFESCLHIFRTILIKIDENANDKVYSSKDVNSLYEEARIFYLKCTEGTKKGFITGITAKEQSKYDEIVLKVTQSNIHNSK